MESFGTGRDSPGQVGTPLHAAGRAAQIYRARGGDGRKVRVCCPDSLYFLCKVVALRSASPRLGAEGPEGGLESAVGDGRMASGDVWRDGWSSAAFPLAPAHAAGVGEMNAAGSQSGAALDSMTEERGGERWAVTASERVSNEDPWPQASLRRTEASKLERS